MLSDMASTMDMTIGRITFKPALLIRKSYTDNGKGTMSKQPQEVPIRAQVNAFAQGQRPEGYAEDDVQLLILQWHIAKWLPNARLQDDDRVQVAGQEYSIAAPSLDTLNGYWTCRGRRKKASVV